MVKRRFQKETPDKLRKNLDGPIKKRGLMHSPNDKGWFEKAKSLFS